MQIKLVIFFGKVALADLLANRVTCEADDAITDDLGCQRILYERVVVSLD